MHITCTESERLPREDLLKSVLPSSGLRVNVFSISTLQGALTLQQVWAEQIRLKVVAVEVLNVQGALLPLRVKFND